VNPIPELSLSWRSGLLLLLPLLGVRYFLLPALGRSAFAAAAGFPGVGDGERAALRLHVAANWLLLLYAPFITIKPGSVWLWGGAVVYAVGVFCYTWAVIDYARSPAGCLTRRGLYAVSRHPQAIAAFLIFFGIGLATASWLYSAAALAGQVAMHWVLEAEERNNHRRFGADYTDYSSQVRRYVGRRRGA
jgi:protein-S-isoprenylcysteine O-methyltransferase Ste14